MTGVVLVSNGCRGGGGGGGGRRSKGEEERENQLSLIALLLAALRRSMVSCRMERREEEDAVPALQNLEIGWPTDVRHIAHVTFDRFNGFLGLPVEFELEIPCRAPSASVSVFGVSAESMQCCYDPKGNSVPTILLLMQERLYLQGGLKAEGIFRINPENGQEEHVREQLNKGIVPDDIDVHCLAGLIKAWFRELPEGVLDCLSPEQVLHCNTEDECVELVKRLLPTQAALLNWAIDLMADVVEEEEMNKMNARNIAMVFAPNMTRMSDPLTALIHAVQVMNLLKTLILKALSEREEATTGGGGYSPFSCSRSSDQQGADETDDQQDVTSESKEIASDDERDGYGQQEVDTSGELRRDISDGCCVNYISEGEDDLDKQIEECFLRQLELKGQTDGDLGGDHTSRGFCRPDQAMQLACSDSNESNLWSFLSMAESKRGSSSTIEETCSEASVTRDAVVVPKTVSKPIEDGQEVQMLV